MRLTWEKSRPLKKKLRRKGGQIKRTLILAKLRSLKSKPRKMKRRDGQMKAKSIWMNLRKISQKKRPLSPEFISKLKLKKTHLQLRLQR